MFKKLLLFILLSCTLSNLEAQNITLSGTLQDSLINKPIAFGSVALVSSDSTLVSHKRSAANGTFQFTEIENGEYFLIVAHPKYLNHTRPLSISQNKKLGSIYLFQKKQLLKRVVIKDKKAIVVRGDTISFAADSFATRQGDVVEDLLKLLPGMEVDESGNITSSGKKVEKVLVNGEEFFGTDPTVATQNLPSKAVEKVEVYDAKDAQEVFSGFVTDKDTKVINLKLKKEMSKGFFGKVSSASGLNNDRWNQSLLLNKFSDKEQLGAYYLSNSNGMASMGWEDQDSYGGTATDDNNFSWNPFGGNTQNGITKSWKTGGRYKNSYKKNNQKLNISYGNSRSSTLQESRSYTENLLPNNTFFKSDTSRSTRFNMTHAINARYETDLDSMLRLVCWLNTTVGTSNTLAKDSYYNVNDEDELISFNNRNANTDGLRTKINSSVTLNKKFNKKGRTLSLRTTYNYNNNKTEGFTQSRNAFNLLNGGENLLVDQKRTNTVRNRVGNANLVFTEPISKKLRLKLNYGYRDSKNQNDNITADTAGLGSGNYIRQIDSLSNQFSSRQLTHTPGFTLRYDTEKWQADLGSNINLTSFQQFDFLRGNDFSYRQTNFIPMARLKYKFTKYKRVSLSYSGRTIMPNPTQLQPFQDNTNPLSIVVGNPNLRMAYTQSLSVYYSSRSRLEGSYFNANLRFRNGINQIGTNRVFDESGRTVTSYLNLPNNYSANLWTYVRRKLIGDFRFGMNLNSNYSYMPNVINDTKGYNANFRTNIAPSVSYYNKDLLYFNLKLSTAYTQNENRGNVERKLAYVTYSPSATLNLFLPQFISVRNSFEYNFQPAVAPFNEAFTRTFMTSRIEKQFLPKKNLALRFEVFDVFNQNRGYSRSNNVNYNTEEFFLTLGRYWMIGATWNFFSGPMAVKRQGAKDKSISGKAWLGKKKKEKAESKKSSTPSGSASDRVIIVN